MVCTELLFELKCELGWDLIMIWSELRSEVKGVGIELGCGRTFCSRGRVVVRPGRKRSMQGRVRPGRVDI